MEDKLLHLIEKINKFIVLSSKNRSGVVTSNSFNPVKKEWVSKFSDFDDIGDYLTLMMWYSKKFQDKDVEIFVNNQITSWKKFRNGNLFINAFDVEKGPSFKEKQVISLYDHQDALLGFIELYKLTKNEEYLTGARGIADSVCYYIRKYDGLIPHSVIHSLKITNPLTLCFSEVAGLFCENLCDLYELTQKNEYLECSEIIFKRWTSFKEFKNSGLFMRAYHPWAEFPTRLYRWHCTKPMKDNTNLFFGFLKLYKLSKSEDHKLALLSILKGLNKLKSDNAFCFWYDFKTDSITDHSQVLTQNHPVIDVFIEAYYLFKDETYLNKAISLCDYWLSFKKNGLIPEIIKKGVITNPNTRIDSFVDFHTNLLKLYSLTGEKRFLKEVESSLDVISSKFVSEDGWFFESVDSNGDGLPLLNNIKFVGLITRLILLYDHVISGGSCFDHSVRSIIRDR